MVTHGKAPKDIHVRQHLRWYQGEIVEVNSYLKGLTPKMSLRSLISAERRSPSREINATSPSPWPNLLARARLRRGPAPMMIADCFVLMDLLSYA
jgi:hypothetical protein